jgi:hypothetical protein
VETQPRVNWTGLPWRTLVHSRANALEDEIEVIKAGAVDATTGAALAAATREIERARYVVTRKLSGWGRVNPTRLVHWAYGADQETAWLALHTAETELTLARPEPAVRAEITGLLAKVDAYFSSKAEPGRGWTDMLTKQETAPDLDRYAIREVTQAVFGESDQRFERMRSFRNILVAATFIVALADAALAAFPALMTDWLGVIFCPTTSTSCPVDNDVWKVELLGALGGLLIALATLQRLRGYRNPYALPFVQALLKIPAGALTGLIGTVIVQSGAFSIDPVSGNKLVAYVILFGAAQETVTRLIDQKASSLVEAANPATPKTA